jgi:hypothetical protein
LRNLIESNSAGDDVQQVSENTITSNREVTQTKPNKKGKDVLDQRKDAIETQYNKLSEDWRQFNNILWGIPTIAVAIMGGIVVAAYQEQLAGIPRFVLLVVGSIFLFVLTFEVLKKRLHMLVISDILKKLQASEGLELPEKLQAPVGLSRIDSPKSSQPLPKRDRSTDFESYWKKHSEHYNKEEWLFEWNLKHRTIHAPRFLGLVIFLAAFAVAFLAATVLVFELILPYLY